MAWEVAQHSGKAMMQKVLPERSSDLHKAWAFTLKQRELAAQTDTMNAVRDQLIKLAGAIGGN
jgi:hypothetical protein